MMRTFFAVSAIVLMAACNDNNNAASDTAKTDSTVASIPQPAPGPEKACYVNITNKDSVELRISKADTVVTGSLRFKNFEKDSSKGTVIGTMKGDTLVAQYTFQAEGSTSVREVVFLLKGETAVEGYGDVEEKDGKMVFKDRSKLKFDTGRELKKTNCGSNAE